MMEGHNLDQRIIRGEELKTFSKNGQVNKFLLFQVYQVWNMQLSKLKHPYFDFDQPEIEESLNVLRNQLSRNIAIKSQDFGLMLKRAVYNNLKLLTDPKEAFTSFFFINSDSISIELFERYTPFFADLDFVVNSILHFHKKNGLQTVQKDAFFEKMDRVIQLYNAKSNESFESYCATRIEAFTGKNLDQLKQEVEAEERARIAAEARKEQEAAARLQLEAAERKAAEEKLRQEEEARLQAAAEQARQAEALRQKEEELKRLEAERIRQEEEQKRMEDEKQKMSFFDTIKTADNFFDIDAEEVEVQPETPVAETTPVVEEAARPEAESQPVVEEEPLPIVEEQQPEPEVIAQQPPVETPPAVEEEITLVETKPEPIVEEPQVTAGIEVKIEEVVAETPAPVVAEEKTEVEKVDKPDTLAEKIAANLNEEKTVFERLKAQADSREEKPTEKQAEVEKAPEKPAPETVETSKESTASFLDRFLNTKKNKVETPETPPPVKKEPVPTIVDAKKDPERPQTIAEKFQQQVQPTVPLHDNSNGINGKIKLDEIPIHKQYQYVQKVFDGNNVRFRIIVDKINNARNKDEVEDILDKFVLNNDSLDRGDGVVKEFLSLLRNRF